MSATQTPPAEAKTPRPKLAPLAAAPPVTQRFPQARRFSRDEYYEMERCGFFQNHRAERIDGEILVMAPQGFDHAFGTDSVHEQVKRALGEGFWVRNQAPLELGLESDPEPDVSVVAGGRLDYRSHPTTALLVIEASDSTLAYDRFEKASLYAKAGIPDYWILDLEQRRLLVYRDPAPVPEGAAYRTQLAFKAGDTIAPLAKPDAVIAVAELLP